MEWFLMLAVGVVEPGSPLEARIDAGMKICEAIQLLAVAEDGKVPESITITTDKGHNFSCKVPKENVLHQRTAGPIQGETRP